MGEVDWRTSWRGGDAGKRDGDGDERGGGGRQGQPGTEGVEQVTGESRDRWSIAVLRSDV